MLIPIEKIKDTLEFSYEDRKLLKRYFSFAFTF